MRSVLKVLERLIRPWTSYPLLKSSSAKYDPSCPVMPVRKAFFIFASRWRKLIEIYKRINTVTSYYCQLRAYIFFNARLQASSVKEISFLVWAKDKNKASNCEGASHTPCFNMAWKKRANIFVLDFCAVAKSKTSPSLKKMVNIEWNRLIQTQTPSSLKRFSISEHKYSVFLYRILNSSFFSLSKLRLNLILICKKLCLFLHNSFGHYWRIYAD